MVSWIRICSNGAGRPLVNKPRFVLYSGKGFYNTYGFGPPTNPGGAKQQIIGYTPGDYENADFGQPHTIENSLKNSNYPINVPSPEVSRIEVTMQNELYRRVTIEWVCFSWEQLVYMTPYFLVPGISCMVEYGWNHYNVNSLVNLGDTYRMKQLWDNYYPLYQNILNSNGNYDVLYGMITNFNWSIEGNKIICTTEVTSKDRLYSGIAKDYGVSVINSNNPNNSGIFKSMRDFINDKQTIKNLKTLVMIPPTSPITVDTDLSQVLVRNQTSPSNITWYDILNPLLVKGTKAQIQMRTPYVFGVFAGRPPDDGSTNGGSYLQNEKFGKPKANDFDYKVQDVDPSKFWINMGMIVAMLNYFSGLPSGANQGNNAFEVDIQNSVISGHPNLISCDPQVLIPNYKAPKYCYGLVGLADNSTSGQDSPYSKQVVKSQSANSPPDVIVHKILFQPSGCYRNDLDPIINYNRYRFLTPSNYGINSYSFPASTDSDVLPVSIRQLNGNKLEQDYSGLLSNIYISFQAFSDAINDDSNASFLDIYNHLLKILMDASDGLWDLQVIEVDGVLTITDKNFVGKYGFTGVGQNTVFSFDYYDADSIIKTLKFRPILSDAQATRVIYGAVNNSGSKYQYIDKNDLLDYQFKDAIIVNPDNGDPNGDLNKRTPSSAYLQQADLVRQVQNINSPNDDGTLQMSLNPFRKKNTPPPGASADAVEIIKLVLPVQQILRLLINDEDYDNNPRYCAVQPGIIMELTMLGIGGIRTFQYFIIKNLPQPYDWTNVIFRTTYVGHTLEAGNWETTIRAQLSPLRGYIKNRIVGPLGSSAGNNGWPS